MRAETPDAAPFAGSPSTAWPAESPSTAASSAGRAATAGSAGTGGSAAAAAPWRLLHLEDSELDHQLMLAHLRRGGLQIEARRVESEADFLRALEEPWDVVVSDYNLPGYSGLVALDLVKARGIATPFVLVSGEIGEDTAVEAMRNGAADYLLKNNLSRLLPALMHAVEAGQTRAARERADADLSESRQRLQELAQHLQTSIERERASIAREIHDDVGGSLTAIKFDLAWIARHAGGSGRSGLTGSGAADMAETGNGLFGGDVSGGHTVPGGYDSSEAEAVRARAASALETVSYAIEASQRIMHNLRPAILEQGLVAALQWMAARFERRTGVGCLLRVPRQLPALGPGVPLVAYRVAQEALTNVTKHAQAASVEIDLVLAGRVLSLEISDDGRGIGPDDLAKARSFGIRGLHERAHTVGGWVDLSSRRGGGTTLILSIPLGPRAAAQPNKPASNAAAADPRAPLPPHDPTEWGDA